jgi:hypothetical protein
MNEAGRPVLAVARAADSVCHLMWLFRRQEPEVRALADERQSLGFPHYLTSRMGVIPSAHWADGVFIAPRSLVEHLLPRCEALDPPRFVDLALQAAGQALGRVSPDAPTDALRQIADAIEAQGELVVGWANWPRSGDRHRDAVRDAMVVREDRAHGHYLAAAEEGLEPLQLMVLTQVWRGWDVGALSQGFKWGVDEVALAQAALTERGLLNADGSITDSGRTLREAVEESTNHFAGRHLDRLGEERLRDLTAELDQLSSI